MCTTPHIGHTSGATGVRIGIRTEIPTINATAEGLYTKGVCCVLACGRTNVIQRLLAAPLRTCSLLTRVLRGVQRTHRVPKVGAVELRGSRGPPPVATNLLRVCAIASPSQLASQPPTFASAIARRACTSASPSPRRPSTAASTAARPSPSPPKKVPRPASPPRSSSRRTSSTSRSSTCCGRTRAARTRARRSRRESAGGPDHSPNTSLAAGGRPPPFFSPPNSAASAIRYVKCGCCHCVSPSSALW